MREYSKVYPQIWIGNTGRELKMRGIETQFLAHYLISSPHANMIGIYYLPISFIAHETGMTLKVISKAMRNLIELDFCSYDEDKEYVWVHNMGKFQICAELNPRDKRVINVKSYVKNLPRLNFLKKFMDQYGNIFCLSNTEEIESSLEAPSKPLLSQEQEQEQEHEHENEQEQEKEGVHHAESQNDSALIQAQPHLFLISNVIEIPLKDGTQFSISSSMITKWQATFPNIDVSQVLKTIQDWNIANPKKRKRESGILRHINLWLAREQDKYKAGMKFNKPEQRHTLFNLNQTIADDWLQRDSIIENGERH